MTDIVLVTGSREWTDRSTVRGFLDKFAPAIVMHGACPTGADKFADEWARDRAGVLVLDFPAWWKTLGDKAGPVRNNYMVSVARALHIHGHSVVVLAFPLRTGSGTQDCVRKAKRAELNVVEVRP